jgi:hypothetical protein
MNRHCALQQRSDTIFSRGCTHWFYHYFGEPSRGVHPSAEPGHASALRARACFAEHPSEESQAAARRASKEEIVIITAA